MGAPTMPDEFTEADIRRVAAEAAEMGAEKAIARSFRLLGVDIKDQRSVNSFRADLIFAHEERQRSERALERRAKMVGGVVIALVTAASIAVGTWVFDFAGKIVRLVGSSG